MRATTHGVTPHHVRQLAIDTIGHVERLLTDASAHHGTPGRTELRSAT